MLDEVKQTLLSVADPQEREYRSVILASIEHKLETNGPHTARPYSNRARQFMPFAALKGYDEMVDQEKRRSAQTDTPPSGEDYVCSV